MNTANLGRLLNIADLRGAARRALPRIVFDYVEGGAEDELCLAANDAIGEIYKLLPRYFGNIDPTDLSVVLMGRRYAAPFGLAPTGLAGLCRPGADIMLARAAAEARIPFVLSTVASEAIEAVAEAAGEYGWMQLYGARDPAITADIIRRADAAGIRTLVVTVDTPAPSKRERNLRNGFGLGKMPWSVRFEALWHPGWIARYLASGGAPTFETWRPYAAAGASNQAVSRLASAQMHSRQTWSDLARIRDLWPHTLVVKGVMHPHDAVTAVDGGADI